MRKMSQFYLIDGIIFNEDLGMEVNRKIGVTPSAVKSFHEGDGDSTVVYEWDGHWYSLKIGVEAFASVVMGALKLTEIPQDDARN